MDAPFAVIFDMDGVLFDTEVIALRCWGEAAKTLRLSGWRELYPQCIGITQPKTHALWVEHWGEENAEAFGKEILAIYDREYAGRPVPQRSRSAASRSPWRRPRRRRACGSIWESTAFCRSLTP